MSRLEVIEAVRTGEVRAVEEILAAGADVNQRDAQGWTPLCWAAGIGKLDIIQLLVQHGADPRATGRDNRSPAAIALAAGRADAARWLREHAARETAPRKYCKVYPLRDVSSFEDWPAAHAAAPEVVYVHETYQVTASIWPDEDVIFDGRSPAWQQFCRDALAFAVPDDLDLIGPRE